MAGESGDIRAIFHQDAFNDETRLLLRKLTETVSATPISESILPQRNFLVLDEKGLEEERRLQAKRMPELQTLKTETSESPSKVQQETRSAMDIVAEFRKVIGTGNAIEESRHQVESETSLDNAYKTANVEKAVANEDFERRA